MSGEINISVLIRLAAEQARREATAFGGDVKAVGAAAEEASRKTSAAGQAIDLAGAAARKASVDAAALESALAQAVSQAAGVTAQMGQAATSIGGVQNAVTGLTQAMGGEIDAMLREQQALSAWQAELDALRARFVPLFAASQQYEQQVRQIAEAESLGAITAQEAAAATYRAEQAYQALSASISATVPPINQMMSAMTGAETAMQGQVAAFAGIKSASESAFASQLRHGAMLDELKARYNPLFAASRQYEMVLREITEAERLGAISTQEAAAARDRAAAAMTPMNNGLAEFGQNSRAAGAYAANLSFQMNDIFMMTAVGQSPWMLMMQQGPQVIQIMGQMRMEGLKMGSALSTALKMVLNPWGLLTMAAIGGGAAFVQWLASSGKAAKSFDDHLKDLDTTLGRMRSNLELVNDIRLGDTFGSLTAEVRALAAGMLELDKASALKSLEGTTAKFLSEKIEPSFGQQFWQGFNPGGSMGHAPITTDDLFAANYSKLGAANNYSDFKARTDEIKELAKSGDTDEVIRKMDELRAAMMGTKLPSELSDELRALLGEFSAAAIEAAQIQAKVDGSGLANSITHQIDQMVQGYTQQVELAEASLRFGENSVEVEQTRARHAREALDAKLEEMNVDTKSGDAVRARAALEGKIAADADAAAEKRRKTQSEIFDDLRRQEELSTAILQYGENSAQVEETRARHAREVLRHRLEEQGMLPGLIALILRLTQAEQDRAKEIKEAARARQTDGMLAELRAGAEINRAIVIYGEDSLQVKRLQIEAEREAYVRSLETLDVSRQKKEELLAAWDAARGLASADPFGTQAFAGNYLRDQQERIDKLRLEQSLLGQSEVIQKRTIALWQVERDLRREGIDLTSARATEIRAAALEEFELTRNIERQAAAWQNVQSSAESAIDGIVEKLMGGDIEGALEALAGDITGMFTELAIQNPLKNAILGTNYGTIQDVGGLKGIWQRLFGGGDPAEAGAVGGLSSVGAMQVNAATVMIGGTGAAAFLAGASGTAANMSFAPGVGTGGLSGSGDVQSQVWNFFSQKGLKPHQVAAIMGNIQGESGFNPLAAGDYKNGAPTSFGLFQHHNERADGLFASVGGRAGLGNVNGQLEYVWKELQTTEQAALKRLMASSNVGEATNAWMRGFERPSDNAMMESWPKRLGAAEAALTKFGTTTTSTTANLGTLGTGFDAFGNALVSGVNGLASGGAQGGLMGFLGTLAGGIASSLGIPGFATGGVHGGGLRIVGEKGPELEYTGPSTILPADLTRSIMAGTRPPASVANGEGPAVVQMRPVFQFNTQNKLDVQQSETTDAQGQRQQMYTFSDLTAEGMAAPGGRAGRTLEQGWGMRRQAVRRG